jgi:hypothetical protein
MEKFADFFWRFLLRNIIWIVPAIYICTYSKLFTGLFVSFMIYYTYVSWAHFSLSDTVVVQRTATGLGRLYTISILIFFLLTGFSTYEGIVDVFGISGPVYHVFVALFAAGITGTLWLITLMLKARRSPNLVWGLLVLYILFDSMTALPYNFLFFYESIQRAEQVKVDQANIGKVIDTCNVVITERLNKFKQVVNRQRKSDTLEKNTKQSDRSERLESRLNGLKRSLREHIISQDEYVKGYKDAIAESVPAIKRKSKAAKREKQSENEESQDFYIGLQRQLSACIVLKDELANAPNTQAAAKVSSGLKIKLAQLCNAPPDGVLKQAALKLYHPRRPALEVVKSLYRKIGGWFAPATGGHLVSSGQDTEEDMLMNISLCSSAVIDILPLLLSLLYAKFKRTD